MNLRRGRSRLGRTVLHVHDVGGDLLRARCGMLDIAGYLLCCRALLFHGGGNGRGNLRHPPDGGANFLDRPHRLLGSGLNARYLLADFAGGLRGLLGERLHFGCHHSETSTGLAGARSLDRGVKRQQIGLAGNGIDQFDHVADAACRL